MKRALEAPEKIGRMAGFDEDARYWIGLSIRESVTNAVHHGNKLDATKKVGVRFESLPDRLVICVQDEGEGFAESDVPDALDPENLLKPSGRGIFYIRSEEGLWMKYAIKFFPKADVK